MDLKPVLQNKVLLWLGALGLTLLLAGSVWNNIPGRWTQTASTPASAPPAAGSGSPADNQDPERLSSTTDLEQKYDQQLASMLRQIEGVSDVSVMVSVDSTESLQLAQNTQQTVQTQNDAHQGNSRSTTVRHDVFTEHTANGNSVPFVTQRVTPKVRGVLVVVRSDDFAVAKARIIDAIRNVLDVPAYKISVEPAKQNS
ncbi:MAG: hypothetical protein K6T31_07915 [Alicyclobacillus sp.]|nr:hypothetical protein [Alicyclobacillus sp.]